MNYDGLENLQRRGQRVNVYPRPRVIAGGWCAQMTWLVYRVDRTARIVELLAPSGHIKNLASVIHHYDEASNSLVLDARLHIDGYAVIVEPRPWGSTSRNFRHRHRRP
ncbi:MAG: hypothetical protein DMD60_05165 [Gemmatimonadetes bacterium]|nr:MAG: hypothetical protein DMD60_05165 [Gemmatimonadota bacterium]